MLRDADPFTVFMAGVITAGLIGFVLQQIRLNRAKVSAYYKPQKVTLETKKSPFQVYCGCIVGFMLTLLWLAVLAGLVYGVVKLWR